MEEVFLPSTDLREFRRQENLELLETFSEVRLDPGRWQQAMAEGKKWMDLIPIVRQHDAVLLAGNVYLSLGHPLTGVFGDDGDDDFHLGSVRAVFADEDGNDVDTTVYMYEFLFDAEVPANTDQSFGFLFELLGQEPATLVEVESLDEPVAISVETLALLNAGHDTVKFRHSDFDEEQCRILSTFEVCLSFEDCFFEDHGQSIFLAIGSNQGPTRLELHSVRTLDADSLANALGSTMSLESLDLRYVTWRHGDEAVDNISALTSGLEQNSCLRKLRLNLPEANEAQWTQLIQSLHSHDTLQVLELHPTTDQLRRSNSPSDHVRRARVVVGLLETNRLLTCIVDVDGAILDRWIYEDEIMPRLRFNRFLANLEALEDEPVKLQTRLASTALLRCESVRNDPKRVFELLNRFLFPQEIIDARLRALEHKRALIQEAVRRLLEEQDEVERQMAQLER